MLVIQNVLQPVSVGMKRQNSEHKWEADLIDEFSKACECYLNLFVVITTAWAGLIFLLLRSAASSHTHYEAATS